MATKPEELTKTPVDSVVAKHTALEEGVPVSNGATAQYDEGDNKRNPEEAPREAQEQPGKSYMTAISGPPASGQLGGPGMSSQHPIGSSPYSIGQADGGSFVSGSMNPPGSIALNGAYSAAHSSAYSSAQRSGSGSGGHVIGEADFSVGMSMGSNAVVSRQLGISQMGSAGAYGTAGMSTFRGSSGELSSGYPGSSGRMAMPGEIMGSVTIPIFNTSPFPVPVTGSSHAGQQQYGDQARFYSGYMNPGAAVGETEWHHSDRGEHNTHYMREGSSANKYGNVMLTHTHRQPLSEENALAMQHQDESLLAAQMSHAHLSEDHQPQSDDVGRTDSKRGVRGAMAPKHSSAANVTGDQQ